MRTLAVVGRIVLVITNIVFLLASVFLATLGFLVKYGKELIRPLFKAELDSIKQTVASIYSATLDTDNFDLGLMASSFCLFLILAGLFLIVLSCMGCCGSCYGLKLLMLVYAIILVILVIVQAVAAALIYGFSDAMKTSMESPMKSSLNEYQGINGSLSTSLGWNWLMRKYDCCGVKDYEDFKGQPLWFGDGVYLTPVGCCASLPTTSVERQECSGDTAAASYDTIAEIASKSNYNKGCLDNVWETNITDNKTYFLIGFGIAIVLQIILIVFACLVYKDRRTTGKVKHKV